MRLLIVTFLLAAAGVAPLPLLAQPARAAAAAPTVVAPLLFGVRVSDAGQPSLPELPGVAVLVDALSPQDSVALTRTLQPMLGRRIDRPLLEDVVSTVNRQLAAAGLSFHVVTVPPQDIGAGLLRLEVLQARVGRIALQRGGASDLPEAHYRQLLRVRPGDLLVRDTLDEDLAWINRSNPYRSATVIAQPGNAPGSTDLELRVTEQRPWAVSVGVDNAGSRITGRDRLLLSAGAGNLFGTDQQVSYSLVATPDFNHSVSHTLGYVVPLPWRHLLSLTASAGRVRGRLPAPFDLSGESRALSLRYDVPLAGGHSFNHDLSLGLDAKSSDNNLLFSLMPVSASRTTIAQLALGYSVSLRDALGATRAGLTWFHSPGGLGGRNSDAAFTAARVGAKARYDYQVLTIDRAMRLPQAWSWHLNLRLQNASGNLLGSEQMALGGFDSVRGLAQAIAYGDRGALLRSELWSPARSSGDWLRNVQASLFVDAGQVASRQRLAGEQRNYRASSLGAGLRAGLPGDVSLRLEAAKVLSLRGAAGTTSAPRRVHLSLHKTF